MFFLRLSFHLNSIFFLSLITQGLLFLILFYFSSLILSQFVCISCRSGSLEQNFLLHCRTLLNCDFSAFSLFQKNMKYHRNVHKAVCHEVNWNLFITLKISCIDEFCMDSCTSHCIGNFSYQHQWVFQKGLLGSSSVMCRD